MSGFWEVESDVGSNYRYYMRNGNPDNLFKKSMSQQENKQESNKNIT